MGSEMMKNLKALFASFVAGTLMVLSCQCVCAQGNSCETAPKPSHAAKCHGGPSAPAEKNSGNSGCCGNCLEAELAATPALKSDLTAKQPASQEPAAPAAPALGGFQPASEFFDPGFARPRPSEFFSSAFSPRAPPAPVRF